MDAIYPDDQLPPGQEGFLALNVELARDWPVIDTKKDPPTDAAKWAEVKNKLRYLKR